MKAKLCLVFYFRSLSPLWLLDLFDQRAILSYILLFEHDSVTHLKDPIDLEDVVIMNLLTFQSHVEKLDEKFNIQNFVSIVSKMAIFCSNNIDCASKFNGQGEKELGLKPAKGEKIGQHQEHNVNRE